ncbi:PREDICTED: chalcone--flavonone isomerase 1-like [Camelina sativa]|uniref:Chalcone-flavonone isomerase family protein n=1 Tax=Camelina sativa TaxID=90675 RepID=A0ABM0THU2_CAMSA|nr:PREDICTED: chalcone--flavonone isomerase 1-like [Camelina sativa]
MSSSSVVVSPSPLPTVAELHVDSVTFAPSVRSPASSNPLFLGGAGSVVEGEFIIFTVVGVYLDANAVPSLSLKWKGKTAEELMESVPFFREIVTGAFEKFIKLTMKQPLFGHKIAEEVMKKCVATWKFLEIYTECEAKAVKTFLEVFKDENFLPGASILFAFSPNGSLTVAFSKDDSIPETGKAVIQNKMLAEDVLELFIEKNGACPGARLTVAERLAQLMKSTENDIDFS